MQIIHNWRWALKGVVLALAVGLSGCVIPRNPFPMSAVEGATDPMPVALLPLGEKDVGGYGGVPTNKLVRVTNRVLNTIASRRNNLIGPGEVAKGGGASAKRVIITRVVRMPSPADVSVVHWNLSVERTTQVRVEMDLLEGEPPALIAQADATESYSDATAFLLVFPIFYTAETLGSATDRAARRALVALFNTAATNGLAKAQSTNPQQARPD